MRLRSLLGDWTAWLWALIHFILWEPHWLDSLNVTLPGESVDVCSQQTWWWRGQATTVGPGIGRLFPRNHCSCCTFWSHASLAGPLMCFLRGSIQVSNFKWMVMAPFLSSNIMEIVFFNPCHVGHEVLLFRVVSILAPWDSEFLR